MEAAVLLVATATGAVIPLNFAATACFVDHIYHYFLHDYFLAIKILTKQIASDLLIHSLHCKKGENKQILG